MDTAGDSGRSGGAGGGPAVCLAGGSTAIYSSRCFYFPAGFLVTLAQIDGARSRREDGAGQAPMRAHHRGLVGMRGHLPRPLGVVAPSPSARMSLPCGKPSARRGN
uniref:Uncharacterized protein n=1 Tax=Apteryx owenii TaxID=8824 RepID=A0A8B9S212_APTOW